MEEIFMNYYLLMVEEKMFMLKKITISCTMLVALTSTNVVMADTVSITGSPLQVILPSSDSLTLLASHLNPIITDTPSTINLQSGVFNLDFSPIPDQNISFVINQDVTINGITHSIPFNFDALITTSFDRLNLHPSEVVAFGDVNFRLLGATTGNLDIFDLGDNNFNVKAIVTAVPEPETYAMLLAGLGLIGFMAWRRKAAAV